VPKRGLGVDVLTAARERIAFAFDRCERIYVSFSAGKDSTVMLHLVMDEAMARGRKVGVLLVDLEAQYRVTMEHAAAMFRRYADHIEPYWVCLPIHLRNAVSVYEPHWVCWDPDKRAAWVREYPEGVPVVSDEAALPFFRRGMEFEEFVPEFGAWYSHPTATGRSRRPRRCGLRIGSGRRRYVRGSGISTRCTTGARRICGPTTASIRTGSTTACMT
jgi:predicted phosphoadenosine phosphosulfate sulfurtransferase